MNLEDINKQVELTNEKLGERFVAYMSKYIGQTIYNEIALAIEYGYQLRLLDEEEENRRT